MSYTYNKSGQKLYFQREGSTYGKVYDPETSGLTAFTAVPATYAHWRRLDVIPDSFDMSLPFIEKLKQFDVGDSKHASMIFNGNVEPVEFTLDMTAQGLEFLMYSIGAPARSSHGQAMTQTITTVAKASISDGDYFLLDAIDSSGDPIHYLIWFDVTGGGSAPTSPTGIADANRKEVAIDAATTAEDVADAIEAVLEALDEITTANNSGAVMTIVHAYNGAVQPAHDGAAATDFIFHGPSTWGSTTYTVTEDLTTSLPSFTLHVEQQNTASAEDIVWDLFGCVIEEVAVDITYGNKNVKYTATIKCPYALEGNKSTNPPPKKLIPAMSAMGALQESASNYLIQEATTDRTPSTVEKVVLTIKNNVTFQSDISKNYMVQAFAGRRDVTLNIVGTTTEKELFNYWQGQFTESSGDYIPSGASGKLNTEFKLQRDATYDYLQISVYNWLCKEHNFHFVNVEEAVKSVDMTFEDGSGDSNGRILDSTTFVSYIDQSTMVV